MSKFIFKSSLIALMPQIGLLAVQKEAGVRHIQGSNTHFLRSYAGMVECLRSYMTLY